MIDESSISLVTSDQYNVIKVCICGKHTDGYLPVKYLENGKVLLHYVDRDTGEIKAWNGSEQNS